MRMSHWFVVAWAPVGLQAVAEAAAAAAWGSGLAGREVIGHSVCKGKHQPWKGGVRQYGCFRHHALRAAKVMRYRSRFACASIKVWK